MPNWKQILDEVIASGSTHDIIRRRYLSRLNETTGRNVIAYYSGWLEKSQFVAQGIRVDVNDGDKNGFMAVIHEMDRTKGLDLILHTPGGETAATESLVDYLRSMFDDNIRAIVPQLAMSAGTMIALACKNVLMGKHSSLGPIDPQIGGLPAHGIIEEFKKAAAEIQRSPAAIPLWQPIIAKYPPTLIGECQKAIDWSSRMVKAWLISGMFKNDPKAEAKAEKIVSELGSHELTLSHARHISADRARELGIEVLALEDDDKLQDAVLSVHHAFCQTLGSTGAYKIIENQNGIAHIQTLQSALLAR